MLLHRIHIQILSEWVKFYLSCCRTVWQSIVNSVENRKQHKTFTRETFETSHTTDET